MEFYHFGYLINKYSTTFVVISTAEGYYDNAGDYQPGATTRTQKRGAIMGLSDNKIYRSEGMLTSKDKQLFMQEPLGCDYDNAHVIFDGNKYKVESQPNDNHAVTGVWEYTLKFVSAFGGDSPV